MFCSRLPKLAVSAKLLCLLLVQVVMCGGETSERVVRLFNERSCSYLRVEPSGRVFAGPSDPNNLRYEILKIKSDTPKPWDPSSLKLIIYAEESKRYLCFRRGGKLVGMKVYKEGLCQFYETVDNEINGYVRYSSAFNPSFHVGFDGRGRPLRVSPRKRPPAKSFLFLNMDPRFSVDEHNRKMGGGSYPSPLGVLGPHRRRHHRARPHRP